MSRRGPRSGSSTSGGGSSTLTGDVTGTTGANVVSTLTGAAGVVTVPNGTVIKLGTTPASTALVNTPSVATQVAFRNGTNDGDISAVSSDYAFTTDTLYLGTDPALTAAKQPGTSYYWAKTSCLLGAGSSAYLSFSGSVISAAFPLIGSTATTSGLRLGVSNVSMASDANKTLAAANYRTPFLNVTSSATLTAQRDIVLPLVTGCIYILRNATTGGQALRAIGASGTGIVIANARQAMVYCDGTNYLRWGPDLDPTA